MRTLNKSSASLHVVILLLTSLSQARGLIDFYTDVQPELGKNVTLTCKIGPDITIRMKSIEIMKKPSTELKKQSVEKILEVTHFIDQVTCDHAGKYLCEAVSQKDITISVPMINAVKKCPPSWFMSRTSSSPLSEQHSIAIDEIFSFTVEILSTQEPSQAESIVKWYVDGKSRSKDPPKIDIIEGSTSGLFVMTLTLKPTGKEDFGDWQLQIPNYVDGQYLYSNLYNFSISYKGPPSFCAREKRQGTKQIIMRATLGSNVSTSVCILSPFKQRQNIHLRIKSANSIQKVEDEYNHSLNAYFDEQSPESVSTDLVLSVSNVSELGSWTVYVTDGSGELQFNVRVEPIDQSPIHDGSKVGLIVGVIAVVIIIVILVGYLLWKGQFRSLVHSIRNRRSRKEQEQHQHEEQEVVLVNPVYGVPQTSLV